MNADRPRMAFVSPLFLFPNDAGGKIRTTNILRGLKGGAFDVTLLGPASPEQRRMWAADIERICDGFLAWEPPAPRARWRRGFDLLGALPVNVAADVNAPARLAVQDMLRAGRFDVVVFDFVHAAVLRPEGLKAATVCFTHNVEAEIFQRHVETARNGFMRIVWASQFGKMQRFEAAALRAFTRVVAVSERDSARFRERYGITDTSVIPTGVDLDHFAWQPPPPVDSTQPPTVVFVGSMDWQANVDGVRFFIERVWPKVVARVRAARFVVVGRKPPPALLDIARAADNVNFVGFVEDVRPYVHQAHAFVIPLRVGGGTRIKAFEAMAMGCPVVSTTIGIEGLDVQDGVHYLCRDDPSELAEGVIDLLGKPELRRALSAGARECVASRFGHLAVARAFERACLRAIDTQTSRAVATVGAGAVLRTNDAAT